VNIVFSAAVSFLFPASPNVLKTSAGKGAGVAELAARLTAELAELAELAAFAGLTLLVALTAEFAGIAGRVAELFAAGADSCVELHAERAKSVIIGIKTSFALIFLIYLF